MGTEAIHFSSLTSAVAATLLLALSTIASCCTDAERRALVDLKASLVDPASRLSSWTGTDCCRWTGVGCDRKGAVVWKLDLRNPQAVDQASMVPYNNLSLQGELPPSLANLNHLRFLDLSMNYFGGDAIPPFLGALGQLEYLNLSLSGFGGTVPRQLGNLSMLTHLDLYSSAVSEQPPLAIDDVGWLSRLSALQHLNLGNVMVQAEQKPGDSLLLALNELPSISELHLSNCFLLSLPSSIPHMNFTYLTVLDLSINSIESATIPGWLFNVTTLQYLDLRFNAFSGTIPGEVGSLVSLRFLALSDNGFEEGGVPFTLGRLCHLQELRLSATNVTGDIGRLAPIFSECIKDKLEVLGLASNELTGSLPDWLGDLKSLRTLDLRKNSLSGTIPETLGRLEFMEMLWLSDNQLNGTVPESLGGLSNLVSLRLASNHLHGAMSLSHFAGLAKLTWLDLSGNSLVVNVSSDWIPPFRLDFVAMSSCRLGPRFPSWLRLLDEVDVLDLSNAGISDTIPDWYWNSTTQIFSLDLSNNSISGAVPGPWKNISFTYVNLRSNRIDGPLPTFTSTLLAYLLSDNLFSGPIMPDIGERMPNLQVVSVSSNRLSGGIPSSICKLEQLTVLDLSRSNLSMDIPTCWMNMSQLSTLDFSSNHLTGSIPEAIGSLSSLESFHLKDNNLSGVLPASLKDCSKLKIMDLGENKLTGSVPNWVGSLTSLRILRLRSNMLTGEIPPALFSLPALQVLDLAHNHLTGRLPHTFGNNSAMEVVHDLNETMSSTSGEYYKETVVVISKEKAMTYERLLSLVVSIDLSGNSLYGQIPQHVGDLRGLQTLNLSENDLAGRIPATVGKLGWLESLDLSTNNLSGEIPRSMEALTYLSHLNLSHNNLSGRIPSHRQFATFTDPSIYVGNAYLCGTPVARSCPAGDGNSNDKLTEGDGEGDGSALEKLMFHVSLVLGFIVGFWAVCGTLMIKRTWREAHFRVVDRTFDRVCRSVDFNKGQLKRRTNRRM